MNKNPDRKPHADQSVLKSLLLFCILIIFMLSTIFPSPLYAAHRYAVARIAAPVLNTPDFSSVFGGKDGGTLKTDRCGMVRELEFIALPGTVFSVVNTIISDKTISYQVETLEYQAQKKVKLYIDSRFIELHHKAPLPRNQSLPNREHIIASLRGAVGSSYVWGGNRSDGINEIRDWFFPESANNPENNFTLSGVDCSGLLYQATDGWTPRNTSQLVSYGEGIHIAGSSATAIEALLQPLDLIVWDGHVVIVLDPNFTIESRLDCESPTYGGVGITPRAARLREIMKTRKPADQWDGKAGTKRSFVVRRWFNGS